MQPLEPALPDLQNAAGLTPGQTKCRDQFIRFAAPQPGGRRRSSKYAALRCRMQATGMELARCRAGETAADLERDQVGIEYVGPGCMHRLSNRQRRCERRCASVIDRADVRVVVVEPVRER